jgi:urease accessory protein
MRVSLADVGRRGRLNLTFALQDGRTILRDSYCEVPFKITHVLDSHGDEAHLILMQCTAGLFGGDDVEITIRVERGVRVRITQQAATRIHPSGDHDAVQSLRASVATGGHLQIYLEPVIPFAGSRLRQSTELEVEPGGTLTFWEGFMAGRVGRGESWQFREFASQTSLRLGDRLVYLDRFCLAPGGLHQSPWAMGENTYWGAGIEVGTRSAVLAPELHRLLPEAGVDLLTDAVTVVRLVSNSGPEFHHSRELFCRLTGNAPNI